MKTDFFSRSHDLYRKALNRRIDSADLDTIIAWPMDRISLLFAAADQVQRHFFADTVDPCAIMNVKSGGCSEDCAFCAQSCHNNATVTVTALAKPEEILASYRSARDQQLSFCVVSSGKRLSRAEVRSLADALIQCGGPTHASLGTLDEEEFRMLRDAGVVCYNHNLETSREYYPRIVSTHAFDERIATVRRAKATGLRVCCGGIFGMGETWEDRKSLCLELRELGVDTIPLNFLNAVAGTRVQPPRETPLEFLKVAALFRLAHPSAVIKIAGGREVNLGRLQPLMFFAGANGYISGNYLTTAGDPVESDDALIRILGLSKVPD